MASNDLWQRAQEAFERVRTAPAAQRRRELDAACGSDAELRGEVESLLQHDTRAGPDFLASPIALRMPVRAANRPDWAARLAGRRIGRYQLKEVLGAGGMGCVFEAQQDSPERTVAVKLLPPGSASSAALARFRFEPEILGRLQHPGIAQVYEAGVHDDADGPLPYFAMELIPGACPLTEYARARRLPLPERIALFTQVCDAVHHGHQKSVIHRDLKPANILIGSDGRPKIIDFGVARATDADLFITTQHTHVGDLIGTLRYMSPEQCDADPDRIDTRSDIYALGVVLYELLTGAAPYETSGSGVYHAIRAIKDQPARAPSAWNPALRGDLDAILLKALQKEPALRYASAAALADDLRRVLRHEPISARPPSLIYVLTRYAKRNAWKSLSFALGMFSLFVAVLVLALVARYQFRLALTEAQARSDLQNQVDLLHLNSADNALGRNDPATARAQLDLVSPVAGDRWEARHLRLRLDQSDDALSNTSPRTAIERCSVDVRGRHLAQTIRPGPRIELVDLERRSVRRTIQPADVDAWRRRALPPSLAADVGELYLTPMLSPAGDVLAVLISSDRWPGSILVLQSPVDGPPESASCWYLDGHVGEPVFHPSRPLLLAIWARDGMQSIRQWDYSEVIRGGRSSPPPDSVQFASENQHMSRLVMSPDGAWLCTIDMYGLFRLHRFSEQCVESRRWPGLALDGHTFNLSGAAFSPDGRWLATASADRTVRVWELERCRRYYEATGDAEIQAGAVSAPLLSGPSAGIRCVTFDSTGRYLCAGDDEGVVTVWGRTARARWSMLPEWKDEWVRVNTLRGHTGCIWSIVPLPDGRVLTSSEDNQVRLWRLFSQDLPRLSGHPTSVNCVAFTPDGRQLISCDGSYSMIVWDITHGLPLARVAPPHRAAARQCACWEVRGQRRLAVSYQGDAGLNSGAGLVLWNLDDPARPQPIAEFVPHGRNGQPLGADALAVAPSGGRLAVGAADGTLHMLELSADANRLNPLARHVIATEGLISAAFLDEAGEWLLCAAGSRAPAVAAEGRRLSLVHAVDGRVTNGPDNNPHRDSVQDIAVRLADAAGRRRALEVATIDVDGLIALWHVDWTTGAPRLTPAGALRGHIGKATGVAFHPRLPRLASVGSDRTLRIWDTVRRCEVVALRGAKSLLNDVAVDPSGTRIATACGGTQGVDNVVILWESELPVDVRARREAFARHRMSLKHAVESDLDHAAPPGRLVDQYADQLDNFSTAEGWPPEFRRYAHGHFLAFVQNLERFIAPAWFVAIDPRSTPADLRRALRHAECAQQLDPWSCSADELYRALQDRLSPTNVINQAAPDTELPSIRP